MDSRASPSHASEEDANSNSNSSSSSSAGDSESYELPIDKKDAFMERSTCLGSELMSNFDPKNFNQNLGVKKTKKKSVFGNEIFQFSDKLHRTVSVQQTSHNFDRSNTNTSANEGVSSMVFSDLDSISQIIQNTEFAIPIADSRLVPMSGIIYREILIKTLENFCSEDSKYHRRLIELENDMFFKVFNFGKLKKKYGDQCEKLLRKIVGLFRKADHDTFLKEHQRYPTKYELTDFRRDFELFKDWRRLYLEGGFGWRRMGDLEHPCPGFWKDWRGIRSKQDWKNLATRSTFRA